MFAGQHKGAEQHNNGGRRGAEGPETMGVQPPLAHVEKGRKRHKSAHFDESPGRGIETGFQPLPPWGPRQVEQDDACAEIQQPDGWELVKEVGIQHG